MNKQDFINEFFNVPIWNTAEKYRKEKLAVLRYFNNIPHNPKQEFEITDIPRVLVICGLLVKSGLLSASFNGWVSRFSITPQGIDWINKQTTK